jgi:hypothetical protein
MTMKHLIRNAFVAVLSVGFAGCEWSGGGDSNSWNDSGSIANFNGSYRGSGSGGYLVSQYSTASSGSPGSTTTISGETIGTGDGSSTSFGGTLLHSPVVSGSLQITAAGGYSFSDAGSGILNGSVSGTAGSVSYPSGGWSIDLAGNTIAVGATITASYTVTNSGSSSSGVTPGSTDPIYAFNVQQSGNKIKIIDNNGSVYEGSLGDMKTTGNLGSGSQGSTFVNGDQVIASFSAAGRSKAGMHVNMTGNFQGTVQGVSTVTTKSGSSTITTTSMALSDRRIIGTWIEDGGMTGDISGVSASAVNVTSSSTSTNSI